MQPKPIEKTAVIGAGSWGTALAKLLSDQGNKVYLWGHDQQQIKKLQIDRENKKYLPGATLTTSLEIGDNLSEVKNCQCVVMVVPSHGFEDVFIKLAPFLSEKTIIVSAVKGIQNDSLRTMTQISQDVILKNCNLQSYYLGILSGPSFASEVAERQPTAVTVSFREEMASRAAQGLFSTEFFRVYTGKDVIGLEISSALKNVIAIAAGICDGLGYGLNTRAALITRGLAEITRLGVRMGAHPLTFSGLGGLGDLVLTCTGNLSRNRSVGLKLGEGKTLEQALSEMSMVAEGIKTTKSCYNLAKKYEVEMPILEQVYQVLYQQKQCTQAVHELFQRDLKKEKH